MPDHTIIREILEGIYGRESGQAAYDRIQPLLKHFPVQPATRESFFSQNDAILITYGDSLHQSDCPPLETLQEFARKRLQNAFSGIHILPFFPYSSDDGFSVMDFKKVNPRLGSWDDIRQIAGAFDLMVDLVLNHISAKSDWFQRYLNQEEGFECLAIEVCDDDDMSCVVRPRTTPLLTKFCKADGKDVHVCTTFSADQVDLNFKSLDVLEKMIEVLLFYVQQGARLIRLDAIAYLWKEPGTCCIHLEQTHDMVKLFRAVLDQVAPEVMIITETNVPHVENISYLGNGRDEAQMVYNFTLPPLLLYTFLKEDPTVFCQWAQTLRLPSEHTTFFNFTASHDGIGVRPLEGILPEAEIQFLAEHVRKSGGRVSCKRNPDGSESPYELNITYIDALSSPDDDDAIRADRFLASQSVPLALPGVPGIYIHSLLGTRNWTEGVKQTGRARTINRQPLTLKEVLQEINTTGTLRQRIFSTYGKMLAIRRQQPAFHPRAGFEIITTEASPKIFIIKRFSPEQTIFALTNVSSQPITVALPGPDNATLTDLISGDQFAAGAIQLAPLQFIWLEKKDHAASL